MSQPARYQQGSDLCVCAEVTNVSDSHFFLIAVYHFVPMLKHVLSDTFKLTTNVGIHLRIHMKIDRAEAWRTL